jgi:hypothetical protein
MQSDYMLEFAEKHNLPRQGRVELFQDSVGPFLRIDHPIVLARFISFVKARCANQNADVYLRGQNADFGRMLPGLYRGAQSSRERDLRWTAYQKLLDLLLAEITLNRFRRDNPGALLQHYGLRTPWLDVVDNIYVALWFARHAAVVTPAGLRFRRRSKGQGWIYLVSTTAPTRPALRCVDLRKQHSSLSVRPHVQHGLSLARQRDSANPRYGSDLTHYLVGRVRFELTSEWRLQGPLSSARYMFPSPDFDSTARILDESRANEIIAISEHTHGLEPGTLGTVLPIADVA